MCLPCISVDISFYTYLLNYKLNRLIAALAKKENVEMYLGYSRFLKRFRLFLIILNKINTDRFTQPNYRKQLIRITRSIGYAELFDRMPSQHEEEDFWVPLLCHGGSLVDRVTVIIATDGSSKRPRPVYRWYPRSLLTTLLKVKRRNFIQTFLNFLSKHFQNAFIQTFSECLGN